MSYFLNTTQLLMLKIPCQCTTKFKNFMTFKMTIFIIQKKIFCLQKYVYNRYYNWSKNVLRFCECDKI